MANKPSDHPEDIQNMPEATKKAYANIHNLLIDLEQPIYLTKDPNGAFSISTTLDGQSEYKGKHGAAFAPALPISALGDPTFQSTYRCLAPFYAGSMANGISSPRMVIALGKNQLMGAYGSGGVMPAETEAAINEIQASLPNGPYAVNLLNSPFEPALEDQTVALLLKHRVRVMEASAYLGMTRGLVHFRASGLRVLPDGNIEVNNRIIAKISRKEIARRFMQPAPQKLLAELVQEGTISQQQANMAGEVPLADDITVEADSGGHTDNRPLICLIPTILAERDEIQEKYHYNTNLRVGAAGGISTPEAALAALMAGAAYVVTGSVNQSCIEAHTSEKTRNLLAGADMADVTMAPAADMFEMGVRVQVLKRGTMYAMRAAKLYETYRAYDRIEDIPTKDRDQIEGKILQRPFNEVWKDTMAFFEQRNPAQISRAIKDPKQKMGLIFRWYLGLSSRWAINGVPGREMDYQIWCGPAMGSFNDWVRSTYLQGPDNRHVADVNMHILTGAAYLYRLRILEAQGIHLPQALKIYRPQAPLIIG